MDGLCCACVYMAAVEQLSAEAWGCALQAQGGWGVNAGQPACHAGMRAGPWHRLIPLHPPRPWPSLPGRSQSSTHPLRPSCLSTSAKQRAEAAALPWLPPCPTDAALLPASARLAPGFQRLFVAMRSPCSPWECLGCPVLSCGSTQVWHLPLVKTLTARTVEGRYAEGVG